MCMPYRITPLVPGEIYHIFNRSIARQLIFKNKKDNQRIVDVINFYRFSKLPLRYSHYNRLSKDHRNKFNKDYLINNKHFFNVFLFSIVFFVSFSSEYYKINNYFEKDKLDKIMNCESLCKGA